MRDLHSAAEERWRRVVRYCMRRYWAAVPDYKPLWRKREALANDRLTAWCLARAYRGRAT